jgi:hypothetical protein
MRRALLSAALVAVGALASCAQASTVAAPPSDPAPAAAVEVRCDGETTAVITPLVQAQADGVHVLIHNVSDEQVFAQSEFGGDGADPGDSEQVWAILPGEGKFRCLANTPDVDPGQPGGWGTFEVLEPPGWVSPELEGCVAGEYSGIGDYAAGARGTDDPQAEAQRKAKDGNVVQAGYATEDGRTYVAIVDGQVKQTFGFYSDGHGGWLLSETGGCSD